MRRMVAAVAILKGDNALCHSLSIGEVWFVCVFELKCNLRKPHCLFVIRKVNDLEGGYFNLK